MYDISPTPRSSYQKEREDQEIQDSDRVNTQNMLIIFIGNHLIGILYNELERFSRLQKS